MTEFSSSASARCDYGASGRCVMAIENVHVIETIEIKSLESRDFKLATASGPVAYT